jgi:hypothetical protein
MSMPMQDIEGLFLKIVKIAILAIMAIALLAIVVFHGERRLPVFTDAERA